MNIFKILAFFFFGGLIFKLLFTHSLFQLLIVLSIFGIGIYFLIKHKLFWKIYAVVFAAISIVVTLGFTFINYEFYDYLAIPFTILTSIALFGFAYKKVISNRFIWIIVFFINVLFLIIPYGNETSIFDDVNDLGLVGGTILLVLYSYLFLPQFIGLFMYSFYSDDIWNDSEIKEDILVNR